MQRIGPSVVYSASDLIVASQCEYAALRAADDLLGRGPKRPEAEDALLHHAGELGKAYEAEVLEGFGKQFTQGTVSDPRGLVIMPKAIGAQVGQGATDTLAVARAGADVIHQAILFDGRMLGFADFLIKSPAGDGFAYDIADAKLARRAKPQAILQVTAYAALCEHMGIPITGLGQLILGNRQEVEFEVARLAPIVTDRRARLDELLAMHAERDEPTEWGDPTLSACGRCDTCQEQVQAHRDLLLVAGMRVTQRAKLRAYGIETIDQLADYPIPINAADSPIPRRTLANLQHQAKMQIKQMAPPEGGAAGPIVFDVIEDAQALAGMPEPDEGDIFFDFEGDPLWQDFETKEWGLEYLFGVIELRPEAKTHFAPFLAHDRAQEAVALRAFLDYVANRRLQYPSMHIYHYADYERAALLRLASRHHIGEDEVDQLLREGVLVDLFPLVKKSIRVSQDSYSIKKLEPLYMSAEELRSGDVKDAKASVVEYAGYCALLVEVEAKARDGDSEGSIRKKVEAAKKLEEIVKYNEDDCVSTLRLRDWLLGIAAKHDDAWIDTGWEPSEDRTDDKSGAAADDERLTVPLFDFARADKGKIPTAGQDAVGLVAAAVGYHRREDKPYWWTHFDRLSAPLDEIADRGAMVIDDGTASEWEPPTGRQKKARRILTLAGSLPPGSELKQGRSAYLLYGPPLPYDMPNGGRSGNRGFAKAKVLEIGSDNLGRDSLVVEELARNSDEDDAYSVLPVVITAAEGPYAGTVKVALDEVAEAVLTRLQSGESPDSALPRPIADLLLRRPPKLRGGVDLPQPADGDFVTAVTDATLLLENSTLAVQGPPGTGKTYVGSHVIRNLVERGWRIGVVSQGHAAVNHMLDQVIEAGVPPTQVGKKDRPEDAVWTELAAAKPKKNAQGVPPSTYSTFLADHKDKGCVVGGTAWDFTNTSRVDRGMLDLLVIDEAGQYSLANTIAVSVCAQRLLLLGDPQQLPQVSQGSHTPPVDGSALGWLSGGLTLPPELGYFLDASWRMHPSVAAQVSRHSYEGRLHANSSVTSAREMKDANGALVAPGIFVDLVEHAGNDVLSVEEVGRVVELVREALSWTWYDPAKGASHRPMTQEDVLVVAPYNAQRTELQNRLAAAGLREVRVGTVDKFQGQEAPVSIVSMTASAPEDVPRGMGFLLSPNRVNVAVSRAQWRAVVVRSPHLTDFMPTTFEGMLDLGGFLGLGRSET